MALRLKATKQASMCFLHNEDETGSHQANTFTAQWHTGFEEENFAQENV